MAENKTKPSKDSVIEFINKVKHEQKKTDSFILLELIKQITEEEPILWGPNLIGFGNYHYKYKSGREGDFFIVGFSPRKTALTIYIMPGFERYEELMAKLGKFKIGKSCLYINKLTDVNMDILTELITSSVDYMNKKYN
jgi:hypothetical protein